MAMLYLLFHSKKDLIVQARRHKGVDKTVLVGIQVIVTHAIQNAIF